MPGIAYTRALLKLSGESLQGSQPGGIDFQVVGRLADELAECVREGASLGVVVGGGNIFRGVEGAQTGLDRPTGDYMGMLATVINALAIQDAIERVGLEARVQSAIRINEVCEDFIRRKAIRHLEKGRVLVFAAGTGNPFFTTDSAAALRAIEISADLMLKATKVDGVYTADPKKDPTATRYAELTYDEALDRRLGVMDQTALVLCRDHKIRLKVYDMDRPKALLRIVTGDNSLGTLVKV